VPGPLCTFGVVCSLTIHSCSNVSLTNISVLCLIIACSVGRCKPARNWVLTEYNSLDDKHGFADFLIAHQEVLVQTIDRTYVPLFDPAWDMPRWLPRLSQVQSPSVLPGQKGEGGLLPAQQMRAAALAARLKTAKDVILVGEMGTGKTATSQVIATLIGKRNWKLVVVCLSQVTHKWKREVEKVLREVGVSVYVIGEKRRQPGGKGRIRKVTKPVLDIMRAMEAPHPAILVMSYETAKNEPRWEHAPAYQRKPIKFRAEVEEIETLDQYPYRRVRTVEKVITKVIGHKLSRPKICQIHALHDNIGHRC
jgi:hypothetical protein